MELSSRDMNVVDEEQDLREYLRSRPPIKFPCDWLMKVFIETDDDGCIVRRVYNIVLKGASERDVDKMYEFLEGHDDVKMVL